MNKKKLGAIITGVIIAGGVIFGISSIERIKPGYVGVVYSYNNGVQDQVLTQGWKFVSPTKKVTKYSVSTEQLYMSKDTKEGKGDDDSFDAICNDGKLNVDLEMSYHFDADKVPSVFTRYRGMDGQDVVNNIVRGKIKTLVNEITSQYSVIDVHMEKKAELNRAITKHLKENLSDYGITVESANLTQTRPEDAIKQAITKRSAAAQEVEAEKQKQQKAKMEAETKKIQAEGEAEAARIKAKGEADANRELQKSLTPELIKKMEIEKWNGSKATTVVNGDSKAIVNTK